MKKLSENIDPGRRHLLGAVAVSAAAAQLGKSGLARAETTNAPAIKPGAMSRSAL
jgi:hypothetical protein